MISEKAFAIKHSERAAAVAAAVATIWAVARDREQSACARVGREEVAWAPQFQQEALAVAWLQEAQEQEVAWPQERAVA